MRPWKKDNAAFASSALGKRAMASPELRPSDRFRRLTSCTREGQDAVGIQGWNTPDRHRDQA